jgi:hypothetical protein
MEIENDPEEAQEPSPAALLQLIVRDLWTRSMQHRIFLYVLPLATMRATQALRRMYPSSVVAPNLITVGAVDSVERKPPLQVMARRS